MNKILKVMLDACTNDIDKKYYIKNLAKIFDNRYSEAKLIEIIEEEIKNNNNSTFKYFYSLGHYDNDEDNKYIYFTRKKIVKSLLLSPIFILVLSICCSFIIYPVVWLISSFYSHEPYFIYFYLSISLIFIFLINKYNKEFYVKIPFYIIFSTYIFLSSISIFIKQFFNIPIATLSLLFDPLIMIISCCFYFLYKNIYLIIYTWYILFNLFWHVFGLLWIRFFSNNTREEKTNKIKLRIIEINRITESENIKLILFIQNIYKNLGLQSDLRNTNNMNFEKFLNSKGLLKYNVKSILYLFLILSIVINYFSVFQLNIVKDTFLDSYYSFYYSDNNGYCSNLSDEIKIIKDNSRVLIDTKLYKNIFESNNKRFVYYSCEDKNSERFKRKF